MAEVVTPPEGFTLDEPVAPPAGFVLDSQPQQSGLESAARGALRNVPLGQQAAAAIAPVNPFSEKPTYGAELEHLTRAAEAGKVQNPKSYAAGATLGTIAPLAIPGAGEALEAAPILGNAALSAIQSQSDTNLTKPTGENLKEAGIAATLGGGIGAIGKGLNFVAPTEQEIAARSTASGIGATSRQLRQMMGADPDAKLKQLGLWLNGLKTGAGEKVVDFANRPGKMLKLINVVHDEAGQAVGKVIDEVAPHVPVKADAIKAELTPILEAVADINPQAEAKVGGIFKRLTKLEDTGKLNFKNLQKLKSHVGQNMGDEPAMAQAYGVLAEHMNKLVDAYGNLVSDPLKRAEYEVAKTHYKNASQVIPIMERAEALDLARGPLGNAGLLGMFGLASGTAAGHPAAGAAGMAASAIGRPVANMLGRNAALKAVPYTKGIAAGAKGLSQASQLELSNYLESLYGKKQQ